LFLDLLYGSCEVYGHGIRRVGHVKHFSGTSGEDHAN